MPYSRHSVDSNSNQLQDRGLRTLVALFSQEVDNIGAKHVESTKILKLEERVDVLEAGSGAMTPGAQDAFLKETDEKITAF